MNALKAIDRIVEGAAVAIFAASTLFICINVANRYLVLGAMRNLSREFEWLKPTYLLVRELFGSVSVMADEVPGFLLVWIAFLGAYLAMRKDGHIAFDLLAKKTGAAGQRALQFLNAVLICGFLGLLLWQSIRMISVSGRTEIETAEIAQGWFMSILPIAAVLMIIAVVARLVTPDPSGK